MQLGPGGPSPAMRGHPDQLVQLLMPVVNEATRTFDAGAGLPAALKETAAAAFLMGRGMSPAQAMDTVAQWRLSGAAQSLVRTQRTAGATGPTGSPAAPAAAGAPNPDGQSMTLLVEQFMRNEATAAAFYQELIDRTEDPFVKDYIRHAMEDEQKHYRMLGGLYRELTGRTYEARPEPPEIPDIAEALRHAMSDEYEATEEYRDVYLRSNNSRIRNLFFELMTDELEHATRFNYALQVLGK